MTHPHSLTLRFKLLDDVAITALGASIGQHETLPYIPGQCLLGAVAARGYRDHGLPDGAWRLFHSGDVRYGCALPLHPGDHALLWPMPRSLQAPRSEHRVLNHRLTDKVLSLREPDRDFRPLSEPYMTEDGRVFEPESATTMRTSLDETGVARGGYLYSLTSLRRGLCLQATVTATDAKLLDVVRKALAGRQIRVGRSRQAEFGRAQVSEVTDPQPTSPAGARTPKGDTATFWCLSDLCLRDPVTEQPTLTPDARAFGLPEGWSYAPEHSFVASRRYSPFNAHRGHFDLERQVIVAGSVLRFRRSGDVREVEGPLPEFVGEHLAEGLGRVVCEPELLKKTWSLAGAQDAVTRPEARAPDGSLAAWLTQQDRDRKARNTAWERVNAMLVELDARPRWRLPSSQWGEVRRFARQHRDEDAVTLSKSLDRFLRATDAARGVRALKWAAKDRGEELQRWLVSAIEALHSDLDAATVLELLATHAVRQQRRQEEEEAEAAR